MTTPAKAIAPLSVPGKDWVICSRYAAEKDVCVRRAVWARYNRKARLFGRPQLIETIL